MTTAEAIIRRLGLTPHPKEGGWFRETWRSREAAPRSALPTRYVGEKAFGTAIYYLLTPGDASPLHRLPTDEIFHVYAGGPATMLLLNPDGTGEARTLGSDILNGQTVQIVVPAGTWQGIHLNPAAEFILLGTTMAPGFDYADYEEASRADVLRTHPAFRESILRLTADPSGRLD